MFTILSCASPIFYALGAALGAGRSTGTRLFSVSGQVKQPGNYEVEMVTTTFRDLMYAPVYGGGIRGDRELKAFIPGGASSNGASLASWAWGA